MGVFVAQDDLYIGGLLEVLNLLFGKYPPEGPHQPGDPAVPLSPPKYLNGIDEIRALQKEFGVFKEGRRLVESLRVLGVGGVWNARLKSRWFNLLAALDEYKSEDGKLNGGDAIVRALIKHLESADPLPVYFTAHEGRDKRQGWSVLIGKGRPVFYMNQEYLTISLPMTARPDPASTTKKSSAKAKAPKAKTHSKAKGK
jgi:hypothetical protein